MKRHNAYTPEGRAGLGRVIAYERKRFRGWVRATVAARILDALLDEHARPANAPEMRYIFDRVACDIANGAVAATALSALELVEMARRNTWAHKAFTEDTNPGDPK